MGDEGHLAGILHRVIDFEEADHETMHLLVFLLMQFLSRGDQVNLPFTLSLLSQSKNLTKHITFVKNANRIK